MVNEKAVAIYGSGLKAISEQYIRDFNAGFWEHQLSLINSLPREDVPHDHVSFLRLTLSHAEEHLFALIFAGLQAPHCPDLWLYRYAPSDLPEMVTKVMEGKPVLTRFGLPNTSWLEIVKALWPNLDDERYRLTVLMLERLAEHFVSTFGRDEYNGLKHGVRLSFGGMSVSFSPEGSPDVRPPSESYITLGDSKFGSRFWNLKQIKGSKNHFHAALHLSNWDYDELGYFLSHAILLIGNMGAAFRTHAQVEGDRTFRFFGNNDAYEKIPHEKYGAMTIERQRGPEPLVQQLLDLEEVRKRYS